MTRFLIAKWTRAVLSIGLVSAFIALYLMDHSTAEYYFTPSEVVGQWHGQAARALGLCGHVICDAFSNLLRGRDPDGTRHLVGVGGSATRRPGFDLTFSAPKSVSIVAALAPSHIARLIIDCHTRAVTETLDIIENVAAFTRRGKGGATRERVGLLFARFRHGLSRAQEPDLHEHAVLINVVQRQDGSFGTVDSQSIFHFKMAAGSLYRCSLSKHLERELGLRSKQVKSWFELEGVPQSMVERLSSRSAAIEKIVGSRSHASATSKSAATLASRDKKTHVDHDSLLATWRRLADEHGFDQHARDRLFDRTVKRALSAQERIDDAYVKALDSFSESKNTFREKDLLRAIADNCQASGVDATQIHERVAHHIRQSPELVTLGADRKELVFTTRATQQVETDFLAVAERLAKRTGHLVADENLNVAIESSRALSQEQEKALRHLTQTRGAIRICDGLAGSGKSTLLDAVRRGFQGEGGEGIQVLGCAVAGKAARGLEQSAGIKSYTAVKMLEFLRWDVQDDIQHGIQQLVRAARGRKTRTADRPDFSKPTVLVIDEAGMVGVRLFRDLLVAAEAKHVTVLCAGDVRQLQPVCDLGGAFDALIERLGTSSLVEMRRQKDEWARDAVKDVMNGEAEKALATYQDRGLLKVDDSPAACIRSLLADWRTFASDRPEQSIVLCPTNAQVNEVNKAVQAQRLAAGELGVCSLAVGEVKIRTGDRIVFRENSRHLGVANGSLATVININLLDHELSVKLDDGAVVKVALKHFDKLDLAYSISVHRGQGITVDRAFVMLGVGQDRELATVEFSRARVACHLYTTRLEAADNFKSLAAAMNKSRRQTLAHDVAKSLEQSAEPLHERSL